MNASSQPVLSGWHELTGSYLWGFNLQETPATVATPSYCGGHKTKICHGRSPPLGCTLNFCPLHGSAAIFFSRTYDNTHKGPDQEEEP